MLRENIKSNIKKLTTAAGIVSFSIINSFNISNATQLEGAAIDKGNTEVALLTLLADDDMNHTGVGNEFIIAKNFTDFLYLEIH